MHRWCYFRAMSQSPSQTPLKHVSLLLIGALFYILTLHCKGVSLVAPLKVKENPLARQNFSHCKISVFEKYTFDWPTLHVL